MGLSNCVDSVETYSRLRFCKVLWPWLYLAPYRKMTTAAVGMKTNSNPSLHALTIITIVTENCEKLIKNYSTEEFKIKLCSEEERVL